MGIPGFFKKFIINNVKHVIVKPGFINPISSISIDMNGLLHKVFSKIYMIHINKKAEELLKEGNKKEGELLLQQYNQGLKYIDLGNQYKNQGIIKTGNYYLTIGKEMSEELFFKKRENETELFYEYKQLLWSSIIDILNEFQI